MGHLDVCQVFEVIFDFRRSFSPWCRDDRLIRVQNREWLWQQPRERLNLSCGGDYNFNQARASMVFKQ